MYTICLGDALKEESYQFSEQVDLVLTDPPFMPRVRPYEQRQGVENKLKKIINPSNKEYLSFWRSFLERVVPLIKDSGYLMFKADDYMAREVYALTNEYLHYNSTLIWNKKSIGLGMRVRKCHEVIEIYAKKPRTSYFKNLTEISVEGSRTHTIVPLRSIITALSIRNGYLNVTSVPDHINRTNPDLWKEIILRFTPEDGFILDPFAGSCSVLDAIRSINRRKRWNLSYYGIELDKEFFSYLKKKYRRPLDGFLAVESKEQIRFITAPSSSD